MSLMLQGNISPRSYDNTRLGWVRQNFAAQRSATLRATGALPRPFGGCPYLPPLQPLPTTPVGPPPVRRRPFARGNLPPLSARGHAEMRAESTSARAFLTPRTDVSGRVMCDGVPLRYGMVRDAEVEYREHMLRTDPYLHADASGAGKGRKQPPPPPPLVSPRNRAKGRAPPPPSRETHGDAARTPRGAASPGKASVGPGVRARVRG